MRLITIVGARPQFIKASVVSKALSQVPSIQEKILHTGQHFDANMSEIFFKELDISPPSFQLKINGTSHAQMTAEMLIEIEKVLLLERPDVVLVYGDTNSTLAGALAASKLSIPVAHVEAGLRSFNKIMPEEQNRILTDHLSSWHFVPTRVGMENLRRENITGNKVVQVGDVMFDAAIQFGIKSDQTSNILSDLGLKPNSYILSTVHRAENTNDPSRLKNLMDGILKVSEQIRVVMPLHPRTKECLRKLKIQTVSKNLQILEPVGYLDMLQLEKNAALIASDSGGMQKEAFFYKVPCVTLREQTEWVELVQMGWNFLVAPTSADFVASQILSHIGSTGSDGLPYGHGDAGKKIVTSLQAF